MKYMLSFLITGSVLFSACAPTSPTAEHGGTSGGHQQGSTQEAKDLIVRDQSTDFEIAFSVRDGDEAFMDYGVSHTKEMHLIVVRDDLQHFQHIHPERDAAGVWRIPFTAPAGGEYWLYADFVDIKNTPHTIRFEREYSGDLGEYGLLKNFEQKKTVNGYAVTLQTHSSADGEQFNYEVMDREGRNVVFEKYLGEKGHSVLIGPSGDFIHTHPFKEYVGYDESDPPVFVTPPLEDYFYRIFTQFQIKGKVITVNFDWRR